MAARIICIWGNNGCGKTTLALNLAAWLAERKHLFVALISPRDYAEIPVYLNLQFPPEKGFKAMMDNPSMETKNFYVEAHITNNASVYVLTAPPGGDSVDMASIDRATGWRVLRDAKDTFDVVIFDCNTEKQNGIQGPALAGCDTIVVPVDENVTYPEWYRSNIRFFEWLKIKSVFVESKCNAFANIQVIFKEMGVKSAEVIPYNRNATGITNDGQFLYKGGKERQMYEVSLNNLWEGINHG